MAPFVSALCLAAALAGVQAASILGVWPVPSRSHFFMFGTLMRELARRGHQVTVVSFFPRTEKLANFKDVDLNSILEDDTLPNVPLDHDIPMSEHTVLQLCLNLTLFDEKVLSSPQVQALIASDERFDLVVSEVFCSDVLVAFAHRFRAPLMSLSTSPMFIWAHQRVGNPYDPSYQPEMNTDYRRKDSLLQKAISCFRVLKWSLYFEYIIQPEAQSIASRYFGADLPRLNDITRNTSVLLVNTHHSWLGAKPYVPAVVEVGGMHLVPPKPLPQALERFVSGCSAGVILFSFGTTVRSATLPADKRTAFVEAFRQLDQCVLWKWEEEPLTDLPANVRMEKWLPQRDLLAHAKTVLFISHGGLNSLTEAVDSAVPLVGIPLLGDQPFNVDALETAGMALQLDFTSITTASVLRAVRTVLSTRSYRDNALRVSAIFKDRPIPPLETAVYWTEYVIRHKGAQHMRSAAVHLSWYQKRLLDVMAALVALLFAVCLALRSAFRYCKRSRANCSPSSVKKQSSKKKE